MLRCGKGRFPGLPHRNRLLECVQWVLRCGSLAKTTLRWHNVQEPGRCAIRRAEDYRAMGRNMGRFSYCDDYLLVLQTALRIIAQSSLFQYRETLLGGMQGDPRWARKRGLARLALYLVANQRIEFFCVLTRSPNEGVQYAFVLTLIKNKRGYHGALCKFPKINALAFVTCRPHPDSGTRPQTTSMEQKKHRIRRKSGAIR